MDIAVVGCGICLTLDAKGTCTAARISLGAVAPRPLLVADAAKALIGTKDYRIKVAGVLARRAAEIALHRAGKH